MNRNGRVDLGEYNPADPGSTPLAEDGDVPVPLWALALQALLLGGAGLWSRRKRRA